MFSYRYYGYRNLNAMMDVRLQVFEMHRHLFHNKDVLDIGCNVGHISIAVARTLGARSVVGIDIDSILIGTYKFFVQVLYIYYYQFSLTSTEGT